MEAARKIRNAVADVSVLRQAVQETPPLGVALGTVKQVQSRRFAGTYADLLATGPYAAAARFFLEELYSDKDFAERDAQFARIAGAIERLFPAAVAETAVALAQLHSLTENLDHTMAVQWLKQPGSATPARHYVLAWRGAGRRADREHQLSAVLEIGRQMAQLTRTRGLRTLLKMMRGPANKAGFRSLQNFLERGFDTFAAMANDDGAEEFLAVIVKRELALIAMLFDTDLVTCETELARTLGQAP